jgi:predicted Zn finger-like uncharacterized protein
MIVICEECGKKYRVNPSNIKGKAASFKCHICSHVIMVYRAQLTATQSDSRTEAKSTTTANDWPAATEDDLIDSTPTFDKNKTATRPQQTAGGIGLRGKMLLLFFLLTIIPATWGSFLYFWHCETTSKLLVQKISQILFQHAEKKFANIEAANAMMKPRLEKMTDKAYRTVLLMFAATLLIIVIIAFIYVHRLTGKIKSLAEVAERISMGELEVEIESNSRDEIGKLARAIAGMQEKIKLSIKRLQQRQ